MNVWKMNFKAITVHKKEKQKVKLTTLAQRMVALPHFQYSINRVTGSESRGVLVILNMVTMTLHTRCVLLITNMK